MPRSCTICDAPALATVNALLGSGMSASRIAKDLGLPYEPMKRHARNHYGRRTVSGAIDVTAAPLSGPETPVEVFRAASGHEPMPHQVEYLEGTLPTCVRKGRQVGMTEAASSLAIWTARSRAGADAVVISPSMRQSSEVTMRARIGLDRLGDKLVQDSASLIRLANGSRIVSLPQAGTGNAIERDVFCPLAQATTYLATAPKSNRSGSAFFAAVSHVEAHGSLPVPLHLRNAAHRGMKQHGIGVGYRYPHDFEGADVAQQYLPDELRDRRYYLPTDQGYEGTIANRMATRAELRAAGRPKSDTNPKPTSTQHTGDGLQKTRETSRRKLAETEKRDARD